MLQMLFRLYPIICLARNSGGADCPCPVLLCFFINHEHSVVAFNHAAYGSARAISEYYFGEYDRLYSDISTGNSRSFLSPTTHNKNVTVRQSRDTRLKPENLTAIPVGVAFVKLCNGAEGYLDMR